MFTASLIGFSLGFLGSMPIAGPIAVLVFDRGVGNRIRNGAYLAVGASIAEGLYAVLAYWGVTELLVKYPWLQDVSRVAAAILLTGFGLTFLMRKPSSDAPDPPDPRIGNKRSFFLGLTVAGLNLTLLATWSALVAAVGSAGLLALHPSHAVPFGLGASLGISTWFMMLLAVMHRFRSRFKRTTLDAIVRTMGALLLLLGLAVAIKLVFGLGE